MKILIVEDFREYANMKGQKLNAEQGFDVTTVGDPREAAPLIRQQQFDVVVVDVLFMGLYQEFCDRRDRKEVQLTGGRYLVSGLDVLYELRLSGQSPGLVIWTSGEANRSLHLLLAFQEFGVRSFCSKDEGTDDDQLARAIHAAAQGRRYIDPVLKPYMPREGTPPIGKTLFAKPLWRCIWRALAAREQSEKDLRNVTGYGRTAVTDAMKEMGLELAALDPTIIPTKPLPTLRQYAAQKFEFMLDDTVVRLYPHHV